MHADEEDEIRRRVLEITEQLQNTISNLSALLDLLATPLEYVNLLPSQFKAYSKNQDHKPSLIVLKYIPSIQRTLLEHVLPTWDNILDDDESFALLEQYFAPDSPATPVAGQIAIAAFSTLMTARLNEPGIRLLRSLVIKYPVEKLYTNISLRYDLEITAKLSLWEDCVRTVLMVPTKVANAAEGQSDIPLELEYGTYFTNLCLSTEILINSLSSKPVSESITMISYLFSRLVNIVHKEEIMPLERAGWARSPR